MSEKESKKAAEDAPQKDGKRFEEAYGRLRELSEKMQSPDISLEEAIRCYEDGMKYYQVCTGILQDAKQTVETFRIGSES